ncbi:MAG TPA: hypothetical protein VI933_04500 [archaeon]|nr:hypothetical protein [archaeon]
MAKGFPLKMRGRIAAAEKSRTIKKKLRKMSEADKLEIAEERLEKVAQEITEDIEALEDLKYKERKEKEFGFLHGKPTILVAQDFVGAAFGAMFFTVTQEVWDISARLNLLNMLSVIFLGFFLGFLLIYFSRRRKFVSTQIFRASALRAVEVYIISFLTSFIFVSILGTGAGIDAFKQVAVITMPAVVSAATADLLFY